MDRCDRHRCYCRRRRLRGRLHRDIFCVFTYRWQTRAEIVASIFKDFQFDEFELQRDGGAQRKTRRIQWLHAMFL